MSVPAGGGYQYQYNPTQLDFGWIGRAWELFRAQMGAWIGAMLILLLISLVIDIPAAFLTGYAQQFIDIIHAIRTNIPMPQPDPFARFGSDLLFSLIMGVVNVVLFGGAYRMAVRAGRGETVAATDILSGFRSALPLIAVGLVTQVCSTIGIYLCILPGFIIMALFMFAPLLVVDRRLGPLQALTESVNLLKSQWLLATAYYFVVTMLGGIGFFLCGVGLLFTYPLLFLSVALAYLAVTQPPPTVPDYGQPAPGVWPPPPAPGQATPPNYPPPQ